MAKRGNGEGNIYKDPKRDRWIGQYSINTINGTKRKSVYGATIAEVRDKLATILNEVNKDSVVDDTKINLETWILLWLENYKLSLNRTSLDNYYRYYNAHIKDSMLGKTLLKKITPNQIQMFINE
jgi:integrase